MILNEANGTDTGPELRDDGWISTDLSMTSLSAGSLVCIYTVNVSLAKGFLISSFVLD